MLFLQIDKTKIFLRSSYQLITMMLEEVILETLNRIQSDTTHIREDIAHLKARDEHHHSNIEKLEDKMNKIDEKLSQIDSEKIPAIQSDLAALKTKAAIGGAIAGSFLGLIAGLMLKAFDWMSRFWGH